MFSKKMLMLFSAFLVLALILAACGADEEEATATPEPEAEVEAPPEEEEAPPPEEEEAPPPEEEEAPPPEEAAGLPVAGSWLARAMDGEFAGTTVEMIGVQVEEEEIRANKAMEPFVEATGIDVEFIGTKAMETQIVVRSDAGDPFDIVDFPQPGLLQTFVDRGEVIDVRDFMDPAYLDNYAAGWLDMATFDGPDGEVMAGVWNRGTHKDVVWYNKVAFDAAGYEVPETWDELLALTQLIADDGDPAWCIGIGSGDATGWVATDWIEGIMLRTQPTEVYDAWVAGELPFSSDEVKNAVTIMSDIMLNPDYVLGGRDQIVSESITDSPAHMFEDPPSCWLHKQAGWIQDFFGEGLVQGEDWDFFYFPQIDPSLGKAAETAADIMVAFNDRPEVKALMEYFATGQSAEVWVKEGGFLSPHKDSSLDWLEGDLNQRHAQVLLDAEVVRFDASDLMPAEVGQGTFWALMTDYLAGAIDLDTALAEIDASWPEGKAGQVDPEAAAPAGLPPEGSWLARAMEGEFAGTTVEMIGVQVEEEEIRANKAMEPFEEATGIDVEFIGTKAMETQIVVRSDAGDPFDIVDFPQPGLLQTFVDRGEVIDVRDFMDPAYLDNYAAGWLDMATFDGPDGEVMAGVWNRGTHKDVVWYNKVAFDAAGYEVPETWDELLALTQLIADDGDPAWCIGIGSGDATGWVATDWIEGIMLRTQPTEVYDAWVAGELPFSSDEVRNAVTLMSDIMLNPDYVLGGRDQIVSESITDSPAHMFEDPPSCWLHKQAGWIQDFFGEGLVQGEDWDFFYFPQIDPSLGKAAETAADIMVAFNDRPEVKALMEYFATGQSAEVWVKEGGFLSPHKDSSLDWLEGDLNQRHAQVLLDAEVVRFDASDLMPAAVGQGTFWSLMTDYLAGAIDLDTALAEIDASWPSE